MLNTVSSKQAVESWLSYLSCLWAHFFYHQSWYRITLLYAWTSEWV